MTDQLPGEYYRQVAAFQVYVARWIASGGNGFRDRTLFNESQKAYHKSNTIWINWYGRNCISDDITTD